MNRPVELAVAINQAARHADEWFDEPDELDRLAPALEAIEGIDDPTESAAVLAFRVTRAQASGEANKRTALLLARWVLDNNGKDGAAIVAADDRQLAELLIQAAAGQAVEGEFVALFRSRE